MIVATTVMGFKNMFQNPCFLNPDLDDTIRVAGMAWASRIRADLDGTIFPYDCSMRLAHVMSTTRIVSSKTLRQL